MSLELVPTICPYCGSGCGLYLVLKDGRIVDTEPWKDHPVNEGTNCPKGKAAHRYLRAEGRLTTPLIRKDGALCPASWDEALELVAARLREAEPGSFGALGSGKTTNEESYVLQKFVRVVMGTNNIEYCARFCHSATVAGLLPTVGAGVMQTSQLDLDRPDCVIIAGVNVRETFPMIARRLLRARRRGADLIVIDPRKTATARQLGTHHLQVRPGTDAALLNAMLRVILDEGLENTEFIRARTTGLDELRRHLSGSPLEELAATASVPVEQIREAARAYARAKTGCILYDEGITQHITGADNVKSLANLALLTGQIGRPGTGVNALRGQINGEGTGDMGCLNVFYPGFKSLKKDPEGTVAFFQEKWGVEGLPSKPGMHYVDILHKCRSIYAVGVNPVVSAPDSNSVKRSLEDLDFLVVQDIFLTETAELADVVLPAATWVEREGIHAWVDRRVQKINKVIDPPGEAKPDWWILSRLAAKMGHKDRFDYGCSMDVFEEIRTCVPQYGGITYERLESTAGGIQWPCPTEDHPGTSTMFVQKFNTPDGLGHFQAIDFKPPAELPDEEYPYALTTGRILFHYHTGSMTLRTGLLADEVAASFVQVNPADARRQGICDGSRVTLRSRRGSIDTDVRISDDVPAGLLFVPFHFGDSCANVLTNPELDPGCKMPEFKVCAVRMEVAQ